MAHTTCKLVWLKNLLQEMVFSVDKPMRLYCDNQTAVHISSNPVFHERTKHIEVDCHFVREKVISGVITTSHVSSGNQWADLFTKGLSQGRTDYICNKLGLYDKYSPA